MLPLWDLQSETLSSEPMAHQMSSSFAATVRDVRHRLLSAVHSVSSTCFNCDKSHRWEKTYLSKEPLEGQRLTHEL